MLYAITDGGAEPVTQVPHEREYRIWVSRLDIAEIRAINEEFNRRIESKENQQVVTSSWLPGSDWTDTPFMPIYEKAAARDIVGAGFCFGLMLWVFFMEHPDAWSFGHYKLNDIPIQGLTYFRIDVWIVFLNAACKLSRSGRVPRPLPPCASVSDKHVRLRRRHPNAGGSCAGSCGG